MCSEYLVMFKYTACDAHRDSNPPRHSKRVRISGDVGRSSEPLFVVVFTSAMQTLFLL